MIDSENARRTSCMLIIRGKLKHIMSHGSGRRFTTQEANQILNSLKIQAGESPSIERAQTWGYASFDLMRRWKEWDAMSHGQKVSWGKRQSRRFILMSMLNDQKLVEEILIEEQKAAHDCKIAELLGDYFVIQQNIFTKFQRIKVHDVGHDGLKGVSIFCNPPNLNDPAESRTFLKVIADLDASFELADELIDSIFQGDVLDVCFGREKSGPTFLSVAQINESAERCFAANSVEIHKSNLIGFAPGEFSTMDADKAWGVDPEQVRDRRRAFHNKAKLILDEICLRLARERSVIFWCYGLTTKRYFRHPIGAVKFNNFPIKIFLNSREAISFILSSRYYD